MDNDNKVLATFNAYTKYEMGVYTHALDMRTAVEEFLNWLKSTADYPPLSNGKPTYDPNTLERVRERLYQELECLMEE